MTRDQITPNVTRVHHDDYGNGTVLQVDRDFMVVLFDGQTFANVGTYVEDVTPATDH